MKRKVFAILLCTVMVMSLAACGDKTAENATAKTEPEPAKVEEVKTEEPVDVKPAETEDSLEATEAPKETTEVSEEKPEPPTEAPEPEEPAEPKEVELTLDDLIAQNGVQEYITDGKFDFKAYGKAAGASDVKNGQVSFLYNFGNLFIMVQVGTDDGDPNTSCVSIGNWDESNPDRWNLSTYSFLFDTGETMPTTVDNLLIAKQSLAILPDLIDWLKSSQSADIKPEIPGADFKPCDPYNDFAQH